MDFTQIKETCLYVQNLDRTREFYEGVLGLKVISHQNQRHIFFRLGTSVLLCFITEATRNETVLPPHYAEGKQHIAFEVAPGDYESVKRTVIERGVTITHEQEWRPLVNSFYFEDPDGHVLEIVPAGMWD
ncbi:VOC family protein [Marinoscillum sp.]|uniref:VOC family protein n=1 Tax=Marinoscillum sp. TaxID=2024838 RepID=UPI003BAD02FF